MKKNWKVYCNIFNSILKEVCPSVAPFLHLEITDGQDEQADGALIIEGDNVKWRKIQKIQGAEFSLRVCVDEQKKFDAVISASYREKGECVIFNMLIERILDEILLLLAENINSSSIQINYPKDAADLLSQAVMDFAYYMGIPVLYGINYISAMPYEGDQCNGHILFVKKKCEAGRVDIEFDRKILFHEKNYRVIRKILQVAGEDKYVVYDINKAQIVGLVTDQNPLIAQNDFFILEFKGHMHWILQYKHMNVLQYVNGTYRIVDDIDTLSKCQMDLARYYNNDLAKVEQAIKLISNVSRQPHGTMVVISSNALDEVDRLSQNNRGIKIKPINLSENEEWICSITSIDGALMVDEDLNCYSIGILLDGPSAMGDISRGARFNSALSYVHWRKTEMNEKVLAIIVSEDKMVSTIFE